MPARTKDQWTITENDVFSQDAHLLTWIEGFLVDRKAQNMSKGTLYFYVKKLKLFTDFAESRGITQITQITPTDLRLYLLHLEETGHNPGGINAAYRALRAFLYWWEVEVEPKDWKNPIKKVKAPKVGKEPLDPVENETVKALIDECDKSTLTGLRDQAILYALLDTGARASEFLALNLEDIDTITGAALIRKGKGRKPRTVFLGRTSRKALRRYLKARKDKSPALWVTNEGTRLTYSGLRSILRRRADLAGVEAPTLHSFRRAFALTMLRNGADIYSLQELMGHADLQILRRYLKQTNEDLAQAHRQAGPVDNML